MALPRYPDSNSVSSETEEFVRLAASMYAADVKTLRHAVLGRDGRPYRHREISPADRQQIYRMKREMADPAVWAEELQGGNIGEVIRYWRKAEEAYRNG